MDIATLLIQLASGAGGGHVAGKLVPGLSLGGVGNLLAGLVGGGLGSQILASVLGGGATTAATAAGANPDMLSHILMQVLGGGAGGGVTALLVGMLRQMFQR